MLMFQGGLSLDSFHLGSIPCPEVVTLSVLLLATDDFFQ